MVSGQFHPVSVHWVYCQVSESRVYRYAGMVYVLFYSSERILMRSAQMNTIRSQQCLLTNSGRV